MTEVSSEIVFKNEFLHENQYLDRECGDYEHSGKKCGEIILRAGIKLWFVCTFCDERFNSIIIFRSHVKNIHITEVEVVLSNELEDPLEVLSNEKRIFIKNDPESNNGRNINEDSNKAEKNTCNEINNECKCKNDKEEGIASKQIPSEGIKLGEESCVHKIIKKYNEKNEGNKTPMSSSKRRNGKKTIHSCTLCQYVAQDKNALKIHLQSKHGREIRQHQCEECGKCFKNAHHLKSHLLIHSGKRPFKCEYCKSDFAHYNSLKFHRYLHTGERPHKCTQCDKGFVTKSALKIHFREHTGETPFNCQFCQRGFASKCAFKRHMISHSGQRAYKCQECKKAFLHKETLTKHMACHSEEKKFACDICFKKFNHKKNLVQHKKLHLNTKQYLCKICTKAFAQYAGLYSHMKYHKEKE